jgi:hypothetical protein
MQQHTYLKRVRCRSRARPKAAARRCASGVPPSLVAAFSTTCGIWSCTQQSAPGRQIV